MFSVLALAASASAYNATVTVASTDYVTIPCSSTTLTYGNQTYTVQEATTLTVKDCSCTDNHLVPTVAPVAVANSTAAHTTSAALANNAGAATVGAAAGLVAAVAYLL